MKKNILILLLPFFVVACTDQVDDGRTLPSVALDDSVVKERWKVIYTVKDSIRDGDLILRCGNDLTSASFRDFSQQEKLYSHSGIALKDDGIMYVYSNMAGDINPNEIMRRDEVDSFLTPANNVAVGIYRYDLTNEELQKLTTIVNDHYINKLGFDMNFNLATDDKMYCAEMIAKAVESATNKRIVFPKTLINDDLKGKYLKKLLERKIVPSAKVADQKEYYALDNLYLNPYCRKVSKIIFGKPTAPIRFPAPENYQH
ncbi:MAG TPA: YiiX/YebB-like N1pC/P60 family cysteine hydrolase [Chitinophagaceae bacterium]